MFTIGLCRVLFTAVGREGFLSSMIMIMKKVLLELPWLAEARRYSLIVLKRPSAEWVWVGLLWEAGEYRVLLWNWHGCVHSSRIQYLPVELLAVLCAISHEPRKQVIPFCGLWSAGVSTRRNTVFSFVIARFHVGGMQHWQPGWRLSAKSQIRLVILWNKPSYDTFFVH